MDYVFDSYLYLNSIIVSIWVAMADIKFHGDVIFLFSPFCCCCCCWLQKCSVPRTYVENINFSGSFWAKWSKMYMRAGAVGSLDKSRAILMANT
jgi:hypothetical protein